jgi:hypothetical protein
MRQSSIVTTVSERKIREQPSEHAADVTSAATAAANTYKSQKRLGAMP